MKEISEITIAVDADTANALETICKEAGTTIEVLIECFMRFSVDPNNLPLLQDFVKDEATGTGTDAASRIVVDTVLRMAVGESLR